MRAQTVALVAGIGGAALLAREALARRNELELAGRTVLIVGGSRGLGLLLAREFARTGARVAVTARDDQELERAGGVLADEDLAVVTLGCDAGDAEQVDELVQRVERELGPISILVNNAAIMHVGDLAQMTLDDFRAAHSSTFWAALHPTLAVLPGMRARGEGRIVNVTSIGGRVPGPHLAPYTAAKFAVVGMSQALRVELARDGIAVTTVVPWFMRTGSYLNALFKEPAEQEFAWFGLGASLPLLSVDAERAAARIVKAARRGEAHVDIGWQAALAERVHGLMPGLTVEGIALANRLLPRPRRRVDGTAGVRGELVEPRLPAFYDTLTAWGRKAADRLNERRGPGPAGELQAQELERRL